MKRLVLKQATVILCIVFFLSGCSSKQPNTKQDIFADLTSQIFSKDLSLEEGYKIVLPYAKKWSDDAIIQKYITNIVDQRNKYKVLAYEFESAKKEKTLSITFNFKPFISENEFLGYYPDAWENNMKFNVLEVPWSSDDNQKDKEAAKLNLSQSNFKNINIFIKSDQIIESAKGEGLNDFINDNQSSVVMTNMVSLFETSTSEPIVWVVDYSVKTNEPTEKGHIFLATFDSITGKLIKKTIN